MMITIIIIILLWGGTAETIPGVFSKIACVAVSFLFDESWVMLIRWQALRSAGCGQAGVRLWKSRGRSGFESSVSGQNFLQSVSQMWN